MRSNVGVNELAKHLATNREGIARLVEGGVIERRADGKFDIDACRTRYIEHLRSRPARGSSNRALLDARTKLTNIRIAEQQHRLCVTDEWEAAWDFTIGAIKVAFDAVPARCFPRNVEGRAVVQREVDAALHEICDTAERQSRSLHETGNAA